LLVIHLAPIVDNTKSLNIMKCTYLLVEISDISDNYLKMTYL